jgi:hypothetical protein
VRTVLVLARLKPIKRMNVMADKKKRNLTSTKRAMLRWTGKEIDQLLEYKATGFKHSEIGELMGRSTKSINVKMSKIRLGVEKASNPVEDLTPFQKNLDETLFGGVSPDDKPKRKDAGKTRGPYKPRVTKLSMVSEPTPVDTFSVPKKAVYVAVVVALTIAGWYLGRVS